LCGSSNSGYVRTLQTALTTFGIPNVAANFRGCSGELNRLARAYHSGVTEDLQSIFEHLQQQYPQHQFVVVGFSLGANVILKWLGERASPAAVRGAVAVSTPFSLAYCSQAMTGGLGQYYGRFFLRRLVAEAERKKLLFRERGLQQQLDSLQACGNLQRLMNLWEFDDRVTAPLHGFAGAEDYYQRCSSLQFLPTITTPTLLIQSLDDPIIPAGSLPRADQLNNNIHVELCAAGGHVGFISRTERYWLENRILRFIRELDQTNAFD
jgi:predicted alpha/beta-fold hydrolase